MLFNIRKHLQPLRFLIQVLALAISTTGLISGIPLFQILLVVVTVLTGPLFCGWLCPFGTLQDFSGRLRQKLKIRPYRLPMKLAKALSPLRYALLAISLFISGTAISSLMHLDPRVNLAAAFAGHALSVIGWGVICLMLFISIFVDRPFCQFLCAEGARYGLMGSLRPVTIVRSASTCVSCGLCNRVCPMHVDIQSHTQVRSLQCINCMSCVSACPVEHTLDFKVIAVNTPQKKLVTAAVLMVIVPVLSWFAYENFARIGSTTALSSVEEMNLDMSTLLVGDALGIADGVYTGSGTGFRGDMTVSVSVQDEYITSIEVTQTRDDRKWLRWATNGMIPEIIRTQTVDVDTVSGATYSSMAIKEAVADALVRAGGTSIEPIVNNVPPQRGHHKHSN